MNPLTKKHHKHPRGGPEMMRIMLMLQAMWLTRMAAARNNERGAGAVEWLIVTGAVIGIALFAGDSIFTYAKELAGRLGGGR